METMKVCTELIKSSWSLIVESENLVSKLTEVNGGRGLVFGSQGFPRGFELPLICPLLYTGKSAGGFSITLSMMYLGDEANTKELSKAPRAVDEN